nr:hypothetical protein [Lichenihabitans psoromatis]
MPRFFFDIHDSVMRIDKVGLELGDVSDVRGEAMRALPSIAKDEIPKDGDKQVFTVFVRDEDSRPIYTATITFAGLWV